MRFCSISRCETTLELCQVCRRCSAPLSGAGKHNSTPLHLSTRRGRGEDEAESVFHYRQGDPTFPEGEGPKIIAHVCSDSGVWRGDVASALSRRWDEPECAYLTWAADGRWQDEGFGLGGLQMVPVSDDLQIANMIACRDREATEPGALLRYGALETCLHKLLRVALSQQASIHLPDIGADPAVADSARIDAMLRKMLHPVEASVYKRF